MKAHIVIRDSILRRSPNRAVFLRRIRKSSLLFFHMICLTSFCILVDIGSLRVAGHFSRYPKSLFGHSRTTTVPLIGCKCLLSLSLYVQECDFRTVHWSQRNKTRHAYRIWVAVESTEAQKTVRDVSTPFWLKRESPRIYQMWQ